MNSHRNIIGNGLLFNRNKGKDVAYHIKQVFINKIEKIEKN